MKIVYPPGVPVLPNLRCRQGLEVSQCVCAPAALHLWQTRRLQDLGYRLKRILIKMGSLNIRKQARFKRKARIRKKIFGTSNKPRLCVFRSKKHIYAQVIDDSIGNTIIAASSMEKTEDEGIKFENNIARANFVGKLIAERAIEKGLKSVVFDRNGFLYHGRVKAVSDGAREAGLDF